MAELTPLEKLQPCLLDRLTDDDPKVTEESRNQRVISMQRYRRGVLRDLEWLFNTSAHLAEEGEDKFRLSNYPEAFNSVINFGTRHLCGLTGAELNELERQLVDAIHFFEPRILRNSLTVKATIELQIMAFEIHGELWANPMPEQLFIKTKIDLETGQCSLGDRADG
ncbi:MAG: lysozyme protein [Pedosphaera sp.]|nr:lysozyme protein [Pedosphaera sp.]